MPDLALTVVSSGISWVQDLGRYGASHLGFPVGGSSDQYSAQCANALVGNPFGAPHIEITGSELSFLADAHALICVTGAECDVEVDGLAQPQWVPLVLHPGQHVRISSPRLGQRTYLAISGQILAETLVGSVSPDLSLRNGHILRPGEVVRVDTPFLGHDHPYGRVPLLRPKVRPIRLSHALTVRVLPGPDWDACDGPGGWLFDSDFFVAKPSNSVGLRLNGPTNPRPPAEVVSRGVPIGAIETPSSSGGLIVLLRARMLTAGYPVVAVAASVDQSLLGQASPGDRIRFQPVSLPDATRLWRAERSELGRLARTVRTLFGAAGVKVGATLA